MSNDITKVIFRKFSNGDVIAIFPQIAGDSNRYHCSSYTQGQHSACDPLNIIRQTKRATRSEYEPLERELTSIGYSLEIIERNRHSFINDRRNQIHA